MKKIVLFVLLSFGMCLFTACSSDNDDKENNNGGGMNLAGERLVGYSDNLGNVYSDFKYDAQGRLISVTRAYTEPESHSTDNYNHLITYSYAENTILRLYKGTGSHDNEKELYTLVNGRIIKAVRSQYDRTSTYEFTYDQLGQIIRVSNSNDMTNYVWENGNIISDGESTYTYTDKPAKKFVVLEDLEYCMPIPHGVDPVLFQQGYFGKYPRNLVKTAHTVTHYYYGSGHYTTPLEINCTYTFDSKGNVTKAKDSKGQEGVFTWK